MRMHGMEYFKIIDSLQPLSPYTSGRLPLHTELFLLQQAPKASDGSPEIKNRLFSTARY